MHVANYMIYDSKSMYYLMGGADPELRSSGASSFLMWHSIKFAQNVTKKFDFEGSIMPNVEPYFRRFGAIQKPYFNISKVNINPILQSSYYIAKSLLGKVSS